MRTNSVTPKISNRLLLPVVMQQLARDDSAGAREFREWLQSKDSTQLRPRTLDEYQPLLCGLRKIASHSPGSDEALRQHLANSAEISIAMADATQFPLFAAALAQAESIIRMLSGAIIPHFGDDHLALTLRGLESHFVGMGKARKQELDAELQAGNLPTEENAIRAWPNKVETLTIKGQDFKLLKGMKGVHCCWGIASQDKVKLCGVMGWKERPTRKAGKVGNPDLLKFSDDHLVFSGRELAVHFVGYPHALKNKLNAKLQDTGLPFEFEAIRAWPDKTAAMTINGAKFEILKGTKHGNCCWAIALKDKVGFAKAAGFKLRLQSGLLPLREGEIPQEAGKGRGPDHNGTKPPENFQVSGNHAS